MNRFEIHIPLRYNGGAVIEQAKLDQTQAELYERFGGMTVEGPVRGWWVDEGRLYEDEQMLFIVDTDDGDPGFWERYSAELKERFEEEAMYVVSYPIHVVQSTTPEPVLSGEAYE